MGAETPGLRSPGRVPTWEGASPGVQAQGGHLTHPKFLCVRGRQSQRCVPIPLIQT